MHTVIVSIVIEIKQKMPRAIFQDNNPTQWVKYYENQAKQVGQGTSGIAQSSSIPSVIPISTFPIPPKAVKKKSSVQNGKKLKMPSKPQYSKTIKAGGEPSKKTVNGKNTDIFKKVSIKK